MRLSRDTFMLTLPDGKRVRCWRKDATLIRLDVARTGTVLLVQNRETEIYERIDPSSAEAKAITPAARRVSGDPS